MGDGGGGFLIKCLGMCCSKASDDLDLVFFPVLLGGVRSPSMPYETFFCVLSGEDTLLLWRLPSRDPRRTAVLRLLPSSVDDSSVLEVSSSSYRSLCLPIENLFLKGPGDTLRLARCNKLLDRRGLDLLLLAVKEERSSSSSGLCLERDRNRPGDILLLLR